MDEILWELRDHSAGLNCGRWDYIFCFIKKFAEPELRAARPRPVTHDRHFLRSYSLLADQDLPSPRGPRDGRHGGADPDQERSGGQRSGDGKACAPTSSARPATATTAPGSRIRAWCRIAREIFDARDAGSPTRSRASARTCMSRRRICSRCPTGTITEAGLRQNVNVGIGYIEAWLRGIGCVPLYNLMEDAATAEISRAQVWQWIRHGARLDDGRTMRRGAVPQAPRRGAREAASVARRRRSRGRGQALLRADRGASLPRIFDDPGLRHDYAGRCVTAPAREHSHSFKIGMGVI